MFSAGKGGMSSAGASSDASVGRFQAGLLSLGSMHAHFGHVNQAMQVLSLICLHTADSILYKE
jgi:anaphase-promoting complex subunit 5